MLVLPAIATVLAYGLPLRTMAPHRCAAVIMEAETLKCEVRKLPKSAIALDITVPKAVSNEIHLKTLAKLAKNAKVPGFRDGKVPPQAVVAKLGMQKVKEATVEQIVDVGMTHSGVGQQIQTVGEARLPEELEELAKRYTVGESISFTVEVDVYPECPIEEQHYKGLAVEAERVEFNQEAYDKSLLKLRNQFATLVPQGPGVPAVEGNEVLVDMNGFLANPDGSCGEALPAVAGGENVQVPLQPGKFMPGLIEGLVGACEGETKEVSVVFPPRSSVPQLAGKSAIFKVLVKAVQKRELPDVPSEEFANTVRSGMTWAELDEKLREGVQADADERLKANTHKALSKALAEAVPDTFEVPETLLDQMVKERFAMMLGDMREQGTSDDKLKELVTPENYERYKKISRPMATNAIKGDFAIRAVAQQQGLSVSRDRVDDEVMTLQKTALQRGEKFKESEVRPKVQMTLEKTMVLDWLESHATVTIVDPKEEDVSEILGQSPEELADALRDDELAQAALAATAQAAAPAPPVAKAAAEAGEASPTTPVASEPTPAPPSAEGSAQASAPGGFEWGGTF